MRQFMRLLIGFFLWEYIDQSHDRDTECNDTYIVHSRMPNSGSAPRLPLRKGQKRTSRANCVGGLWPQVGTRPQKVYELGLFYFGQRTQICSHVLSKHCIFSRRLPLYCVAAITDDVNWSPNGLPLFSIMNVPSCSGSRALTSHGPRRRRQKKKKIWFEAFLLDTLSGA
jgi:hypothetical protein